MSSVLLGSFNSSSLILINQSDILIILNESEPGEELMHDPLFEVSHDSELLEVRVVIDHVLLHLQVLIVLVVVHFEGELIGVVVQVDEAVVQEEPVVALLPI
jgi:hypothetical protein